MTQLLLSVVPDPSVVDSYANSLLPVFQVSVLSFGVAFAVAFRASLGRRVMILLNVVLFLLVSAVVMHSSVSSSLRPDFPWVPRLS